MNLKDWMVTLAAYKVVTSGRPKWKGWTEEGASFIESGASVIRGIAIVWMIGASIFFLVTTKNIRYQRSHTC